MDYVVLRMRSGDPGSERLLAELRQANVDVLVAEDDGTGEGLPTLECGSRLLQGTMNIEMYYLRGLRQRTGSPDQQAFGAARG